MLGVRGGSHIDCALVSLLLTEGFGKERRKEEIVKVITTCPLMIANEADMRLVLLLPDINLNIMIL